MRIFRFLVVVCGILLLLTACTSQNDGNGSADSSAISSSRSSVRSAKSSVTSSARSSVRKSSVSSRTGSNFLRKSSSSMSAKPDAMMMEKKSSSSRSGAPFFSLQSSSESTVVYDLNPDSSSGVAAAGTVKVHLDTDKGEARAGDQVSYIVTVKNLSDRRIDSFQAIFSFSPVQLTVVEADGAVQPGAVQWTVTGLEPGQKRALRVRAVIAGSLLHGEVIRANAVATVNGVVEPQTGNVQVSVIDSLPATGLGDGTLPLENTRRFLTPFRSGGAGAAFPAIVWGATLAMGLSLGSRAAKKFMI